MLAVPAPTVPTRGPAKLAAVTVPDTPTPPVTTSVPVPVVVDAVFCVRVTAPFAVSVVNAPVLAVLAPTVPLCGPAKLAAVTVPPTPRPPAITTAPVVVLLDAVVGANVDTPDATYSALFIVVAPVGASIYTPYAFTAVVLLDFILIP